MSTEVQSTESDIKPVDTLDKGEYWRVVLWRKSTSFGGSMSEEKQQVVVQQILGHTSQRVETGVVQFGDDWPGVFIRGDNAIVLSHYLKNVMKEYRSLNAHEPSRYFDIFEVTQLESLAEALGHCDVRNHGSVVEPADTTAPKIEPQ